MKTMSAMQGAQATIAALNAELSAATAIYKQESALAKGNAEKLADIAKEQTNLANEVAAEIQKVNEKAAEDVAEKWRTAFEKIGDSVSSSIMGMIEHHESLRQAAQKILLSMIQDEISANVKKLADWLANIAQQTAATVMGQTAQTTAVVAGQAAQTGAVGAGTAARAATATVGLIPTLVADAKAVFSGIFGFLAPIMGPAAAIPATAGAALASSPPGFADGSWQVPSDMFAQLHQGEMIVPAAHTPWAQDLMSNAGGSGNSGGDEVHHHYHMQSTVHVHANANAKDINDVVRDAIKSEVARGGFAGWKPRNRT
jgi:hypothetical protein